MEAAAAEREGNMPLSARTASIRCRDTHETVPGGSLGG